MFRVGAKIRVGRETRNTGIFFFCLIFTVLIARELNIIAKHLLKFQ